MYPRDNIFNIYNKIGKRLPFQVKRSAKGKGVTDTQYRYSQEGYTFVQEDPVLKFVVKDDHSIEYAEERRLFYDNYKIAVQYVVTHYSCVTKKHMDLNCGFVQTSLKYVIS